MALLFIVTVMVLPLSYLLDSPRRHGTNLVTIKECNERNAQLENTDACQNDTSILCTNIPKEDVTKEGTKGSNE